MGDFGGYIWFIGLALGLLLLVSAYVVGETRKRKSGTGDPNHAWEQAAAETGHPEVARPAPESGGPPPR